MTWKVDGWVRCPGCGEWGDAAAVFGEQSDRTQLPHTDPEARIEGLEDGLSGTCDSCGQTIVVSLTVGPEGKESPSQ